jgi:hypothetical protein
MSQLKANSNEGGIIGFDIDNIEAGYPIEDGESHQLLLARALSPIECAMIDYLNGDDCGYQEDGEGEDFRCWLDCGPLNIQARAYLLALRA